MSMEIYVLSDQKLNSMSDWQSAIDAKGFPLRLSAATPFASSTARCPSCCVIGRRRSSAIIGTRRC